MYLLDTNILSEIMRPNPSMKVVQWLSNHHDLYITSITVAELLFGVHRMPDGKRKSLYLSAIHEMITQDFNNRIISFNLESAKRYATLTAQRFNIGKPIHTADAQIAAIASVHNLILVTRNTKDFTSIDDLTIINPF